MRKRAPRWFVVLLSCLFSMFTAWPQAAGKASPSAAKSSTKKTASASKKTTPQAKISARRTIAKAASKKNVRSRYSPWSEPTFADSTIGDDLSGEDLAVREAAVRALGPYNGSVVVVDPQTGRILSMVNQKLALSSGFQPCSTVKLPVALAGLSEHLIARDTPVRIEGTVRMTLTEALARSNNAFFAILGNKLGFERFSYYARLLGLGEKAGYEIEGEKSGYFPSEPPTNTSLGMMCSFGEGISLTPLELAAMLTAFSNGGTLYYLQYPRSLQDVRNFVPRVKRHLSIEPWLEDLRSGMQAAVEYGTARRAQYAPEEAVFGKTGTCTERRTHLGWFGSFNMGGRNQLVVVVLLTGGAGVSGPTAAEIAGNFYKNIAQSSFFARRGGSVAGPLLSLEPCCLR